MYSVAFLFLRFIFILTSVYHNVILLMACPLSLDIIWKSKQQSKMSVKCNLFLYILCLSRDDLHISKKTEFLEWTRSLNNTRTKTFIQFSSLFLLSIVTPEKNRSVFTLSDVNYGVFMYTALHLFSWIFYPKTRILSALNHVAATQELQGHPIKSTSPNALHLFKRYTWKQ